MSVDTLRAAHVPGRPLILPNAWDADTARMVEQAGFPVVATSSVAVAKALGFADGESAPVREMFAAAARIAAAVSVPVTVDAEAGYGLDPAELAERLLETGAVGCNIEETDHHRGGLRDPGEQAALLAAVSDAAAGALFVNARVDVFLAGGKESEPAAAERAALGDGVRRARRYLDAGADCVYPIHLRSVEVLGEFTEAVAPASVNGTYLPDGPSVARMADAGLARVSLGGGLWSFARHGVERALSGIMRGEMPY